MSIILTPEVLRKALHDASIDPKSTRDEAAALGRVTYYVRDVTLARIIAALVPTS